jgi:protein NrfC
MSEDEKTGANKKITRRNFLAAGGAAVAADALIAASMPAPLAAQTPASYPDARGYLVYDSKKCIGCTTCMLSCSLTHHGHQSLSLARIQIIQDSFGKFPNDLKISPCRQCKYPVCVASCPVGAAYVDAANGNIRRIDSRKCIGCKTCIKMCPQQPHRTIWNHLEKKSLKCDLCIDTPHWNETGGPGGRQACIESCPVKALKFVTEMPEQKETDGYDVNLRNDHWLNLGLVENSAIVPPRQAAGSKL